MSAGADAAAADKDGLTPLHDTAQNVDEVVARFLIGAGADAMAADLEGQTPLHDIAQNVDEALARLLMGAGADVSVNRLRAKGR